MSVSPARWLDILPALPLAKGVPVIAYGLTAVVSDVFEDGPGFYRDGEEAAEGPWRVDLNDPQGFGYALRYACQHCDPAISYLCPAMATRWIRDETTDADRLDLAQAIADVAA